MPRAQRAGVVGNRALLGRFDQLVLRMALRDLAVLGGVARRRLSLANGVEEPEAVEQERRHRASMVGPRLDDRFRSPCRFADLLRLPE